jgi:hypothetical protein
MNGKQPGISRIEIIITVIILAAILATGLLVSHYHKTIPKPVVTSNK